MAGWIKMRVDLLTHPKVVRIASALNADKRPATKLDRLRVVGGLHAVWSVFDAHSADGTLEGYAPETLDDEIGWPGFCRALEAVGWLDYDGDITIALPEYEEHNGASAKRRAQDAQRKRDERSGAPESSAGSPDSVGAQAGHASASSADKDRTREDKRREEKKTLSSPAKLPTCPVDKVIELYHEVLPEMPRARLRTDDRVRAIRKTWTWLFTDPKPSDSKPRATTADEALEWLRGYFGRARENDFLMGRTERTGEHANWKCDLDFLLTARGMKHVIEKT